MRGLKIQDLRFEGGCAIERGQIFGFRLQSPAVASGRAIFCQQLRCLRRFARLALEPFAITDASFVRDQDLVTPAEEFDATAALPLVIDLRARHLFDSAILGVRRRPVPLDLLRVVVDTERLVRTAPNSINQFICALQERENKLMRSSRALAEVSQAGRRTTSTFTGLNPPDINRRFTESGLYLLPSSVYSEPPAWCSASIAARRATSRGRPRARSHARAPLGLPAAFSRAATLRIVSAPMITCLA